MSFEGARPIASEGEIGTSFRGRASARRWPIARLRETMLSLMSKSNYPSLVVVYPEAVVLHIAHQRDAGLARQFHGKTGCHGFRQSTPRASINAFWWFGVKISDPFLGIFSKPATVVLK